MVGTVSLMVRCKRSGALEGTHTAAVPLAVSRVTAAPLTSTSSAASAITATGNVSMHFAETYPTIGTASLFGVINDVLPVSVSATGAPGSVAHAHEC